MTERQRTMLFARRGLEVAVLLVALCAGCKAEEKVTQYKPFFTGLSGAEFNTAPVESRPQVAGEESAAIGNVIENPDGSRTLVCKSVRSLMSHLERELDAENSKIILEQLISKRTFEEFESRGDPPSAIIDFLQEHRRDIAMLFARMPMAEQSPTVILKQPGNNVWVLHLTGAAAKDIRFNKLWVVMERGNWKFYWVT
jgi:hypothetical protein